MSELSPTKTALVALTNALSKLSVQLQMYTDASDPLYIASPTEVHWLAHTLQVFHQCEVPTLIEKQCIFLIKEIILLINQCLIVNGTLVPTAVKYLKDRSFTIAKTMEGDVLLFTTLQLPVGYLVIMVNHEAGVTNLTRAGVVSNHFIAPYQTHYLNWFKRVLRWFK